MDNYISVSRDNNQVLKVDTMIKAFNKEVNIEFRDTADKSYKNEVKLGDKTMYFTDEGLAALHKVVASVNSDISGTERLLIHHNGKETDVVSLDGETLESINNLPAGSNNIVDKLTHFTFSENKK